MKVHNILLFLFLLCLQSLSAKNHSESFHMPRVVYVGEISCDLPPPSVLNIDAIGSDWVDVSWPTVPGAAQYRLQAFDGGSGNDLGPAIFVPGTENTATVSTLGNSGSAYVRIWSVCDNGNYNNESYEDSETFEVVIIDLIVMGYSPQNSNNTQVVGVEPEHGADISWAGEDEHIKIQYTNIGGSYSRNFMLQVKAENNPDKVTITDSLGNAGQHIIYTREVVSGFGISLIVKFREVVTDPESSATPLCTLKVALLEPNFGKLYKKNEGDPYCIVERVIWRSRIRSEENPVDNNASLSDKSQIAVNPNPFSNTLSVQLPKTVETGETTLQLFDIMGKRRMVYQAPAGQTECMLQTTQLQPGVYFLRIESNGKMETHIIVKAE